MRKTDKPTPGAPQRKYNTVGPAKTPSKLPTGRRQTKPVIMVKPKAALKKSAVRNPKAPKPVGSGTTITLLNKAESMMKRDKAGRNRSGLSSLNKNTGSRGPSVGGFPLKPDSVRYARSAEEKRAAQFQAVKNTPDRGSMSSFNDLKRRDEMMRAAAGGKGNKPTKVTPTKKTPPTPPKPKSRFKGRPGLRGGMGFGGGGLFGSNKNK